MIEGQDIQEQVPPEDVTDQTNARPDAGLASDTLGTTNDVTGFRSITEAQREVFALHEIAQTIGSSLNMNDTVTLVSNKLRAIVPFDTCIIFVVDDCSGKSIAIHCVGDRADLFERMRMSVCMGLRGLLSLNGLW